MLEINGELYTTTNVLCKALNVNPNSIRSVARRYRGAMVGLSPENSTIDKTRLALYKKELEIEKLRDNTKLWSEAQMIFLATKVCSDKSTQFILDFIPFIKENAVIVGTKSMVSRDEWNQLRDEIEGLRSAVQSVKLEAKGDIKSLSEKEGNVIHGYFAS